MKQLNSVSDFVVFSINLTLLLASSWQLLLFRQNGVEAAVGSYVRQICRRIPIHTTAERSKGDNGFGIHVQGLPALDKYKPGETYKVEVSGSDSIQELMGVMLIVSATDAKGHVFMPGYFNTSMDIRVMDLVEDGTCDNHVISHRYLVNKPEIFFLWTAPKTGVGCVHFNASVIEHSNVWFKDDGNLHRVLCEEQPTQQDSAASSDTSNHIPGTGFAQEECCACGHAMYNVEFQGTWSRQTHPRGFPIDKNAFLLHWSNVVGATHSSDYQVWDYGQYASKAVKEICEYGASRSLENEMKENSEKIRTVIKTKQLWGPERILDPLNAVFTVNKKKHLLSLLTMIGPSPDWCIGVSSQSMCMPNCTWRESMDIDLYPWDAGADDRVTYMGRKVSTEPQDIIRRITSSFPSDRDSPFYGERIKPFAKLTIRKRKEACTDESGSSVSSESSPTTDELVSEMKKNMMEKKKLEMEKCATSAWTSWSDCSNPCGSGIRERRRSLTTPGISPAMCNTRDLQESETCLGDCQTTQRKKLNDNFIMRHDQERDRSDVCAVTGWSAWSPCSVTCGLGMKERWRMFLYNSEKRVDCGIHLMEKDLCRGAVFDCRKAMMMKNFTAICQHPVDTGPCRGNFTRWFYNHTRQKCETFSYGGCRGNENRFVAETECVDLCAEHMADVLRDGASTAMDKKMMMEKQLMIQKQRMMEKQAMEEKQKAMEEDMRRKEQLMERRRMDEKKRMMEKQAMMEKQKQEMMLEKKRAMMLKQQMMEEKQRMQKERMMQKQNRLSSHHTSSSSRVVNPGDQYNSDAAFAEKQKMKMMMKKKKAMMKEKRRRRRRRQRKLEMMKARMAVDPNRPSVDCMVTPWTDWSECSVTCGRGHVLRTRMIKVKAENGGRPCPSRLVKKKKCRRKKCAVNCEMGEWGSWSSCSESCGDSSVQTRRRPIVQKPKYGGLSCPSKREKRFCNVAMCPDPEVPMKKTMSSLSEDWSSFEQNMEKSMRQFMMFHRRY